jgi:hypothetical protein
MIEITTGLIWLMLHAPGGREVIVNPRHINAMRTGEGGSKNKLLVGEARCALNMNDGKLLNVIETCAQVRRQIDELEKRQ